MKMAAVWVFQLNRSIVKTQSPLKSDRAVKYCIWHGNVTETANFDNSEAQSVLTYIYNKKLILYFCGEAIPQILRIINQMYFLSFWLDKRPVFCLVHKSFCLSSFDFRTKPFISLFLFWPCGLKHTSYRSSSWSVQSILCSQGEVAKGHRYWRRKPISICRCRRSDII